MQIVRQLPQSKRPAVLRIHHLLLRNDSGNWSHVSNIVLSRLTRVLYITRSSYIIKFYNLHPSTRSWGERQLFGFPAFSETSGPTEAASHELFCNKEAHTAGCKRLMV